VVVTEAADQLLHDGERRGQILRGGHAGAELIEPRVVMDTHELQHGVVVPDRRPQLLQHLHRGDSGVL